MLNYILLYFWAELLFTVPVIEGSLIFTVTMVISAALVFIYLFIFLLLLFSEAICKTITLHCICYLSLMS